MAQEVDYSDFPQTKSTIDYSDFPEPIIDYSDFPITESTVEEESGGGILGGILDVADKAFTTPEFMSKGYDWLREHPKVTRNIPVLGAEIPWGDETLKPGLAMMEALSTPGDIALMAGTGGAGILRKGLSRVAGGLLAARGGERMYGAEDLTELGVGALETIGGLFGMKTRLPKISKGVTERPIIKPTPEKVAAVVEDVTPKGKLLQALDEAEPLNVEQVAIYSKGIREKVAEMTSVKATGAEGYRQRTSALAGKYDKVEITPLSTKISHSDLDNIIDEIEAFPDLLPLESRNAQEGMMKLYFGNVPQPNEIALLRKVYGGGIDEKLIKAAGKGRKRPEKGIVRRAVGGTQDLMRAILTSYDFSAPGRQGKNLISRKEYWTAFPAMFRSWGSERLYKASQEAILAHPNFMRPRNIAGKVTGKSLAERAELSITDLLTNREEIFRSRLAEKIPGIRMSERAYVGFLNKLRSDRFNAMVDLSKKSGNDITNNDVVLKQVGHFINDATGRGNLGPLLEDHAPLMNAIFFAPRLHAGKLRMWGRVFNPKFYTRTDPMVRKEVLRSLFASTSLGLLVGEMARMAGAEVNNDPTNSDFRKIKIGDTRVDPFGGDQQYGVAVARLMTGQSTSSTTERTTDLWKGQYGQQTPGGVVSDFMANRLAPIPSMAVNLFFNRNYGDPDFGVQSELMDKAVPIMVQDIFEIMENDPALLPLAVPAAFGVGIQTYGR